MNRSHPDNRDENMIPCDTFRDDLEGYALGALDAEEQFRIETHLDTCASCREALARIHDVTDFLPFLSGPADPSAEVKTTLLARIAGERHQTDHDVNLPGNPWQPTQPAAPNTNNPETDRFAVWQKWIVSGLVAPLAIALIVLSAWTNSLQNEVDELRGDNDVSQQINVNSVQGHELQVYDFKPACPECQEQQASGQLGGNPNSSIGVVMVWNLDPNEKHQVWCINKQGEKLLVSDLDVEHEGHAFQTIAFPQELGGYQQIYVAQHDGSRDPDAELLVAMNDEHESDGDATPSDDDATT